MAKIWQISDGRSYIVNGDPGTTITYTNSTSNGTAAGKQAASIPAGATSVTFISNGSEVEISQDTATIDQVFNAAAAGAGSSSGGSGSSGGVSFQIVDTLPSQGAAGVIYLVKVSETGDDKFEEWIWVDSAWESIGTTAVDPTTYAKLVGGNDFTGNQTVQGDVTVNGSLTVTGDSSGIVDNNYNLVETADSTITPQAGTWTRYTGSETALTIEEPAWTGDVDLAYLETTVPVTLTGVTWSPAAPVLTGDGPFVYTLVHSREGEVLAGAYGYSTPTAEAIQEVVPIDWGGEDGKAAVSNGNNYQLAVGQGARVSGVSGTAVGAYAKTVTNHGTAYGYDSVSNGIYSVALGYDADSTGEYAVALGSKSKSKKPTSLTIGAQFVETVNGQNVTNYCETQGTGSITIGAGANTLNTTTTVDGVETTVESSNSVTIGCKAENKGADSVAIGAQAKVLSKGSVVVGAAANGGSSTSTVAVGASATAGAADVALGFEALANQGNSVALGFKARAFSTKNVALGSLATIINTTAADSAGKKSENTTVIGYGANAFAPNAVVLGAGANAGTANDFAEKTVTIGAGATTLYREGIAIGYNAKSTSFYSIGLGGSTVASGNGAFALGFGAESKAVYSTAIGTYAKANNDGVVVFASYDNPSMTTKTQLYFSGANTQLANEYYNGEAMMGYTVTDSAGAVLACGTRRLSELFPDNSLTQPASLDENGEWVQPKVFHPADLDLPIEEPTEPENVEINIPETEPEPYTPLPVYPIVEPEIPTEEQ